MIPHFMIIKTCIPMTILYTKQKLPCGSFCLSEKRLFQPFAPETSILKNQNWAYALFLATFFLGAAFLVVFLATFFFFAGILVFS